MTDTAYFAFVGVVSFLLVIISVIAHRNDKRHLEKMDKIYDALIEYGRQTPHMKKETTVD